MSEPTNQTTPKTEPAKNIFSDNLTQDPSEHMVAMGAPRGKGKYSAMPPSQHRSFLDLGQTEENRLHAAIWQRVIVPNAQDWTLAAFARESNEAKTPTGVQHLSDATGIAAGNVSAALKRLEARGLISILKKPFRIYLCYNVPAPNTKTQIRANKEQSKILCTNNFNSRELLYLQHLQQDSAEQFRTAMARLVAQKRYDEKLEADTMAWTREREAEAWVQRFMEIGYTETEPRGRTRKRPASNPEHFKPAETFEQFFVQNEAEMTKLAAPLSVQNGEVIVYAGEINSEQKPHPYGLTHHSLTQEQLASKERSNANAATHKAELKTQAAGTEIRNEINARLQTAKLTTMGALKIDAGTVTTMAGHLMRLNTAGAVRQVLDVLEDRARELKTGKRVADGWGYLVNVVKGEVEKRLPADLKTQIKSAAAGKGIR